MTNPKSVPHRTRLLARLLSSALVFGVAAAALPISLSGAAFVPTAAAQASFDVSFDSFHDQLARYGDWVYSDRWGTVWVPADVGRDFHPYDTNGRWERTRDYGWTWSSDYAWGDIAFHYGRWVNDIDDGWIWLPGYVWSPGWVVWRGDDSYMGWMPMPPDDDFLRGDENVSFKFSFGGSAVDFNDYNDGYYGYTHWYGRDYDENRFALNWVFIGADHIGDRDYRPYVMRQPSVVNIIHQTRNVTNYTVVNNYIVNRSADGSSGARRHQIARPAAEVLHKPASVRTVDAGRQIERRTIQEAPRGNGVVNSAPKPPPAVAAKLSNSVSHGGARGSSGGAGHLYTRDRINTAPATAMPASLGGGQRPTPPAELVPGRDNLGQAPRPPVQQAPNAQPPFTRERANQAQQDQERTRQAQEKQAQEKQVQERQAQEKQAQDRQAQDRQAQERQAQDRQAQEKRAQDAQAQQLRETQQREADQLRRRGIQVPTPQQPVQAAPAAAPAQQPPAQRAPAQRERPQPQPQQAAPDQRGEQRGATPPAQGNDDRRGGRRNQDGDRKDGDKDKKDENR